MNALPLGAQPGLHLGLTPRLTSFMRQAGAEPLITGLHPQVFRQKLVSDLLDSESWGLPGTVCHPDGCQRGPTGPGSDLRGSDALASLWLRGVSRV